MSAECIPYLPGADHDHNSLTSSVPSCVGNLIALQALALDHNSLSSTVPISVGNVTNVLIISLGHNSLSGSIPVNLVLLPYLQSLDLSFNYFTGSLPTVLCSDLPSAQIFLAGNGFLCYLSCQADGEWTSSYSVPRCPDQQDVAFSDLDNQLTVSTALAKVISTTVVHYSFSMAGSDRQSDSVYIVYQYPNAFEYLVSCTQYSVGVDITICPYAVYSEWLPFEIVIGGPSFEIKGQSVRPLTLNLTITVYSVAAVSGWSFEKPPVRPLVTSLRMRPDCVRVRGVESRV